MTKLIIIGIDGATFDLFGPWVNQGELPNIKKLIEEGVHGRLESCQPPVTAPAWKCFSTGKNPAKLGIFWWRRIDVEKREVIGADPYLVDSKEFWDYIGRAGYKSVILGIPLTYPKKEMVNTILISGGPFAEVDNYTYPPELKTELENKFNYKLHPNSNFSEKTEEVLNELLELINLRFEAAKYLLDKENPDLLNVTCFYINALQHFCWNEEPIREAWKFIDKKIGELIREVNEDFNVIIMSDHGISEIKREFYINTWLMKESYLKIEEGAAIRFKLKINEIIKKHPKLISLIRHFIPKSIKQSINIQEVPCKMPSEFEKKINWEKSTAIATAQGPLYLNVPQHDKRYEKIREEIAEKLKNLTDPITRKRVIRKVYKKEEIYDGQYLDIAPDLVLESEPEYWIREGLIGKNNIFGYSGIWKATNFREGIFIAHGPDIKQGVKIENVKIIDLAPTILHMMYTPIPKDMDGRVLKEIFEEESELAKRSIKYREVNQKERIKERIKKLKAIGKI